MRHAIFCLLLITLAACQSAVDSPVQRVPRTLVNVGGPERVFERPVTEIIPELQQATLTRVRGRVGNELVFWAYDLPGGERRWLYGCAVLPDIDCEARAARVCPATLQAVLVQREEPGAVRHLDCQLVGQAAPGDLYPNCTDRTETLPVKLGLLDCGQ